MYCSILLSLPFVRSIGCFEEEEYKADDSGSGVIGEECAGDWDDDDECENIAEDLNEECDDAQNALEDDCEDAEEAVEADCSADDEDDEG